jgi:hypothetical protein
MRMVDELVFDKKRMKIRFQVLGDNKKLKISDA